MYIQVVLLCTLQLTLYYLKPIPRIGHGGSDDVKATILDENGFWVDVVKVLRIAVPIIKLLRLCDNQSKEAMGKIYYKMFMIGQEIEEAAESFSWASEAKQKFDGRWEYLHGPMHAAGYALDPEFLYSGDGGALDSATMDGLMLVVERMALRSTLKQAVDLAHARDTLTTDSPQVQELAATCMLQFSSFRAQEGILTKTLVVSNAKHMPPSQWWQTYGGSMPELQSIATSVFKQPVSACAAERNWSVYGSIKGPARSRLQHERADKRVYCHEALHYQKKLQSATYRQEIVAWDSDSDDDGAGDDAATADDCDGLLM
jgi:hypothetical protein